MIRAVNIADELAPLPFLDGRGEATEEQAKAAFAELSKFRDGAIFAGSFNGQSPWERHRKGDEIVQILAGETNLTIITPDGHEKLLLGAGMLVVVPQGCWHRFEAPESVTVMTATPLPTDLSFENEPE
jgi:uncharacterized cupin superfamily protein